jgi:hypothetical protein
VAHITVLCFLTNLSSFINLGTRFLEGGGGCNTLLLL